LDDAYPVAKSVRELGDLAAAEPNDLEHASASIDA
jgi:hypothetical protein